MKNCNKYNKRNYFLLLRIKIVAAINEITAIARMFLFKVSPFLSIKRIKGVYVTF